MNNSKLNELLTNLYNGENVIDCKVQIYQDYSKFASYYISHVLTEEKQINKFVNIAFDNTFTYLESNVCTSQNFIIELYKNLVLVCNNQLSQTNSEYNNWGEVKFDFIPEIEEKEDFTTNNSEIYSEKYRRFILTMLGNLPNQEKIVAFSYYFLDLTLENISNIINVDLEVIKGSLKSVKYNIETNLKYLSNTTDDIFFSKSIIKNYLYTDLNTYSPALANVQEVNNINNTQAQMNPYVTQAVYTQNSPNNQNLNTTSEPDEEKAKKSSTNNSTQQNKDKTLIWLLIILAVVVILAVVFLLVFGESIFAPSRINETTATTKDTTIVPVASIEFSDEEIYIYKGEEYKLNVTVYPYNSSYLNLQNIIKYSPSSTVESDWYYRIQDDTIISYNKYSMSIKALSVGTSQFRIISGRCEDENGELIQDTLIVHVLDKVETFEFNEDGQLILENDDKHTINLSISPYSARENVIWKSSDESVCTVDNGVITAKAPGECIIIASIPTLNGSTIEAKTASINVRVLDSIDKNATVTASFTNLPMILPVNQPYVLNIDAQPSLEYVKVVLKTNNSEKYNYDPQTRTLIGYESGMIIICLTNIINNEILTSQFVTFE